ncbi:MAG: aldo/keto reductase [Verrucomicrobia bacterium]|nr:aldo/keto reductase [Verrucomicrobiota bacterium]
MRHFSRRDFIRTSFAGAGLLATAPGLLGAEGPATFRGTDIVTLGKTGIQVSRLAQGTGYNGYNRSSAQTRAGKEAFDRLVGHSIDQGIRFMDMADLYGSHPFVKDVLRGKKRNQFALLTKLWPRKEKWVTPSGGAKEEIDRFRKELDTDVIDVCLIHCMTDDKWATQYERIRDELSELKQRQVVRAVGVSCHDFGALKLAAGHPWVDVIFARVNHKCGKEYACDASVEEVSAVLKTARQNGKAVVGMKIFGAGKLVKPQEKDASLNYIFKNGLVDAITVGMCQPEEVDDTLQRMAKVQRA